MAQINQGLYINGMKLTGVTMGDGFIQTLEQPLEMKENIINESRLENGRRVVLINKVKARSITLTFNIHGSSRSGHDKNLEALMDELYKGNVKMYIIKPNTIMYVTEYNLVYTGKSISYARSFSGCDSKLTCGFDENYPVDDNGERGRKKVAILNKS